MEGVRSIRKLVEEHGRLGAIARHDDRRLVEIVAAYGADEDVGIPNFLYSGWCMTSAAAFAYPRRRSLAAGNGNIVLLVEPGRRAKPGKADEFIGVPYGPTARLILIYLQSGGAPHRITHHRARPLDERLVQPYGKEGGRQYLPTRAPAGGAHRHLPLLLPLRARRHARDSQPEHH